MANYGKVLLNWLKLCNLAIDSNANNKDYSIYSISKGNLQINDIAQWNLIKNFINSVLSENVKITDNDLKKFKEIG